MENDILDSAPVVDNNLDALLDTGDGQKLNKLSARQDYDGKRNELILAINLDELVNSAVRKTVQDPDGRVRKMTPAVMLCADVEKLTYVRNGIAYELELHLGRAGQGSYFPFKIRKIGTVTS